MKDNENQNNIDVAGDAIARLVVIINDSQNEDDGLVFYIRINDLAGQITRVLQNGNDNPPFLNWIGDKNNSFTREAFINTMEEVWSDLFN